MAEIMKGQHSVQYWRVADDEKGVKWWIRYVIVPLLTGGVVVAIVATVISMIGKPKVFSDKRELSPNTEACYDNQNKGNAPPKTCTWLSFRLKPKLPRSNIEIFVTLDGEFTVAPGPYTNSNGCTGDAQTTDKWRSGDISVKCGYGKEEKSEFGSNDSPYAETLKRSLSVRASCDAYGDEVDVVLTAWPRGCSSMKILKGVLRYDETAK